MALLLIFFINLRMIVILKKYIIVEVERMTYHIVNQAIKDVNFSLDGYKNLSDDSYSYNLAVINDYKDKLSKKIQEYLIEIEKGNYSDLLSDSLLYNKNKYKWVRNGYLCEISYNSIFYSSVFSNIGPTIPIKLSFIGNTSVNIDIKTRDYGINNVIIEIYAIVDVSNQISLPISTKKFDYKIKEPIIIDVVKGDVPNYYVH